MGPRDWDHQSTQSEGVLDGYIFPRHPVIAPEVNGVFDMFCGSSLYLFSRCLDVWGVIWKSLHPAFPQVQLDTSAVPDTNCAQTGAIWLGSSAVPLISTAPLNARDARTKPSDEKKRAWPSKLLRLMFLKLIWKLWSLNFSTAIHPFFQEFNICNEVVVMANKHWHGGLHEESILVQAVVGWYLYIYI